MKYPFTPKSTSYIEPGQIWAIPLSNGKYACGVVLAKLIFQGKIESRSFYAGLLDWCSSKPPEPTSLNKNSFIKKGALHVKAISNVNSAIIGKVDFKGLPKNPSEYTDDIVTMGYNVLSVVAEKRFVKKNS